ncbi:hypothetical protein HDU97_005080 [Phlyctochytrium planicorne]|nr:hypothetical protein HDU97_005080 [Phlyctochytrium planicorne]
MKEQPWAKTMSKPELDILSKSALKYVSDYAKTDMSSTRDNSRDHISTKSHALMMSKADEIIRGARIDSVKMTPLEALVGKAACCVLAHSGVRPSSIIPSARYNHINPSAVDEERKRINAWEKNVSLSIGGLAMGSIRLKLVPKSNRNALPERETDSAMSEASNPDSIPSPASSDPSITAAEPMLGIGGHHFSTQGRDLNSWLPILRDFRIKPECEGLLLFPRIVGGNLDFSKPMTMDFLNKFIKDIGRAAGLNPERMSAYGYRRGFAKSALACRGADFAA